MQWVLPVIAYNIGCEIVLCNTWHWLTYAGPYAQGKVKDHKLNKDNQYLTPDEAAKFTRVGMFWSTNGNLQREIFFTTLGWIQSSMFQVGPAKPSQAKPSQAKPSQAKPSQAKPSQAKPSLAKRQLR
eukprot:SAG22_NODE_88_length_21409_cov_11.207180_7_plen_127_part_00